MPASLHLQSTLFPAGITDPGYNALQIARFVYEMRFNSSAYV